MRVRETPQDIENKHKDIHQGVLWGLNQCPIQSIEVIISPPLSGHATFSLPTTITYQGAGDNGDQVQVWLFTAAHAYNEADRKCHHAWPDSKYAGGRGKGTRQACMRIQGCLQRHYNAILFMPTKQ